MYIAYDEYVQLYDPIDEKEFRRLSHEADRLMENQTTGIDGYCKLREAMPVDEHDRTAVKYCAAQVVYLLHRINNLQASGGFESTDLGMRGKVISSISSGNESISYSTGTATAIEKAASDLSTRRTLLAQTIREHLSGVHDANGVNLLYMGAYPRRNLC